MQEVIDKPLSLEPLARMVVWRVDENWQNKMCLIPSLLATAAPLRAQRHGTLLSGISYS